MYVNYMGLNMEQIGLALALQQVANKNYKRDVAIAALPDELRLNVYPVYLAYVQALNENNPYTSTLVIKDNSLEIHGQSTTSSGGKQRIANVSYNDGEYTKIVRRYRNINDGFAGMIREYDSIENTSLFKVIEDLVNMAENNGVAFLECFTHNLNQQNIKKITPAVKPPAV